MASFKIYLLSYTYGKDFNRDQFTTMFPESMITVALTDPDEKEVGISERVVTPYILDYLSNLLAGGIPEVPKDPLIMKSASRYLTY